MYKNEKGVTLVMLIVTVIVMLIISGVTLLNANQFLEAKTLVNLESDITVLQEEIPIYFAEHNELPKKGSTVPTSITDKFNGQKNVNDSSEYYIINLDLLPNLNLNYGYGKSSQTDYYIVNASSFAVYYCPGIEVEGTKYYTINQNGDTINSNINSPSAFSFTTTATSNSITVNGTTTSNVGIKGYRFSKNNEGWSTIQSSSKYTFTGLTSGTSYIISMQAIDNNGNIYIANNQTITTLTKLEEKFKDNTKIPYVINYPVAIDENETPEDDWQVFYIENYEGEDNAQAGNQPDKGRRVFLIASDYVKILDDPDSAIQKSMKKANFVQNSEDDKKDYGLKWNNVEGVVYNFIFPNQEGKANIFPKLFEESSYGIWNNQDKVGSKVAAIMLNTDYWSDFKNGTYADYAIGGPTYAMWIHSWNMRHPDKEAYYKTNEYGYLIGLVGQDTRSYILETETDALYFPHGSEIEGDFDQDGLPEYCEAYWGASPCALYNNGANLMRVGGTLGLRQKAMAFAQ